MGSSGSSKSFLFQNVFVSSRRYDLDPGALVLFVGRVNLSVSVVCLLSRFVWKSICLVSLCRHQLCMRRLCQGEV